MGRHAAVFTSDDGDDWASTRLDGGALPDPFFLEDIIAIDGGAMAVDAVDDQLRVWRFTDG